MEPAVQTGALAYVLKNQDVSALREGDIITFQLGENLVTHRIVKIKDGAFVTKGDANDTVDMTDVTTKQVRGKLAFSIPYLGFIFAWFGTKVGKAVLFWVLIVFLIIIMKF